VKLHNLPTASARVLHISILLRDARTTLQCAGTTANSAGECVVHDAPWPLRSRGRLHNIDTVIDHENVARAICSNTKDSNLKNKYKVNVLKRDNARNIKRAVYLTSGRVTSTSFYSGWYFTATN
jgi:hypothetical protein